MFFLKILKFALPGIMLKIERASIYQKKERGSYMSVHVLLNVLNEFGKGDKVRSLLSILSLLKRLKFNKFNKTGAHILYYVYYLILKLHFNLIFA